jgi:predicted ArsR family transcriptional regulator
VDAIVQHLRMTGPATAAELAADLQAPRRQVERDLRLLAESGRVRRAASVRQPGRLGRPVTRWEVCGGRASGPVSAANGG